MQDLSIAESAIAQHEILSSYIKAGFTRAEAFELLKTIITTGMNQKK